MAGVMRDNAPPETPFLTSAGGNNVNQTPVIQKFKMLKPTTEVRNNNTKEDNNNKTIAGGVLFR